MKMRMIDLLNKIAKGKIEEDIKIIYHHGMIYGTCTIREFFNEYIMDKENLNLEIELDDTPKVQVEMTQEEYNKYLDSKLDTPKEDKKIEYLDLEELNDLLKFDLSYDYMFHKTHKMLMVTKGKINEIIDRLNGEE